MRSEKSPTDIVKSVELGTGMDDHGSQGTPRPLPPASRRSTKGKAPAPPAAKGLDGQRLSLRLLGSPLSTMDQKENLIDKDLNLTVVLPGGVEKTATVPGSKPMMDLLVTLCAKYHLNPSSHTIELISTNRNHIKFKPNALIGALEAEKILLKPKGVDEKSKKTGPQMPEATVRLVINYKKTQKTILRVNPRVPLEELMPAVCEKCEFDQKTSVLTRDVQSGEPLDLTKSLNDFGLREVYARDTKSVNSPDLPSSPIYEGDRSPSYKSRSFKEKENKGLFSMFRKSKKKTDQAVTMSAPTSPVLGKPRPVSMPLLGASASVYESNTMPSDVPKKRRAPLPPITLSQSLTCSLSELQPNSPDEALPEGDREASGIRRGSSTESSLKRTKRKAPPPPSSPSAVANQDVVLEDGSIKAGTAPHSPLEEISEQEEMAVSAAPDPSTVTDVQMDDGSPDPSTDGKMEPAPPPAEAQSLPSPLDGTGEDQSNDLSSDGKPAKDPASDQESTEQTLNSMETAELEHRDSAGTDLSPPAEVEQAGVLEENGSVLGDDKEKSDSGVCTAPSTPEIPAPPVPQPLTRDGETMTCDEQSGEAPEEHVEKAEVLAVDGVATLVGDASTASPDVQLPVRQEAASPTETARLKRDMATSTEEPPQGEAPPTLPQEPKSPPIYLLDYSPKPKPSNELTREYIPKVGLTTYTIVPQKSLEKLRFFEVELTLETPGSTPGHIVAVGPQHCLAGVPADQLELLSPTLRVGTPLSNGRVASSDSSHGNALPAQPAPAPADSKPPSPYHAGGWAAAAQLLKQKKIPPATKPKPGSFRLSLHKRSPGYVTSAAVKSANASHWTEEAQTGQDEPKPQEEKAVDGPTSGLHSPATNLGGPAPRPVDFAPNVIVPAPGPTNTTPNVNVHFPGASGSVPRLTRQLSLPAKDPVVGLSLERLRSFVAPKPYVPVSQSRFARAVSSAIKRSQSFTKASSADPQSPSSLPTSPLANQHSIKELAEPSRSLEKEAQEKEEGKLPAPQREEQPDCGTGGSMPSKTPGGSDRGATRDAPADGTSHAEGETNSPAVPDALPPLSLNGGPTETQPTEVE
ncbi:hypothetical protein SKAU_G00237530 [Synaphobranchus kaupii]|uniref:Cordon-bleu ubiquitin-like domain-containing protein n=1 Tax=Synaphobranchus kaupii TaxID=118154 RepID=A0A9Q1F6T9_SYNKA|nr:hypothetical protein SKAU_G00237530 [Synaphobranchus kaupii]